MATFYAVAALASVVLPWDQSVAVTVLVVLAADAVGWVVLKLWRLMSC